MSIGSMISQARISVGLTIDDLSDATNIRSSLLKEMESDDFSNCGGQTYFRGHLRKIASVLGVDCGFRDAEDAGEVAPRKHLRATRK